LMPSWCVTVQFRPTRKLAAADGLASGLEEWKP
jgi:hypothetical protein